MMGDKREMMLIHKNEDCCFRQDFQERSIEVKSGDIERGCMMIIVGLYMNSYSRVL